MQLIFRQNCRTDRKQFRSKQTNPISVAYRIWAKFGKIFVVFFFFWSERHNMSSFMMIE